MRILALNPPFHKKFSRPQRSPAVTKSGTLYFPIWLAQAVAVLEADGFDTTFLDAPAAGLDLAAVLARVAAERPVLAILDASTPSIKADVETAARIREVSPGTLTLLVGTHVSALPEKTLQDAPAVDAVARREYDHTARELARSLKGGKVGPEACRGVAGLSFRDHDGTIVHNPDRPLIADLDELPPVSPVYARHLDFRHYFNPNARYPMVTLVTSRGCPFRCGFCVYPQTLTGRSYRFRSIGKVLDEVDYVLGTFPGLKSIFFEDDTLTAKKSRCLEFCRAIAERGLKFAWSANSRADLDLETLAALKAAGCTTLCVGFESGEEASLAAMKKGLGAEAMRRFMREARKVGVRIHGCFIFGFPGETEASIMRTIDFAISLGPDTAQFYPVMVYPGTEAYADYKERGFILTEDFERWLTPEGLHNCVVRNETLSPEKLVRLCDYARRRFYLRPRFMAAQALRALSGPAEFTRVAKAGMVFARHLLRGSRV